MNGYLTTLQYDSRIMHTVLSVKPNLAMAKPCNGLLLKINQRARRNTTPRAIDDK